MNNKDVLIYTSYQCLCYSTTTGHCLLDTECMDLDYARNILRDYLGHKIIKKIIKIQKSIEDYTD